MMINTFARSITTTATLRPFGCELTTLVQADGSAIWKSGGTSVMTSVHGPAAPRQASLEQPYAQVSLVLAGKSSSSSTHESSSNSMAASDQEEWEPLLRQVLEQCIQVKQYPRSVIQIVCHVLSNDGSVLAACLHATVAALMDAGIALRQLPTAAAIRVVCKADNNNNKSYHLSLDPDMEQELDTDLGATNNTPSALLCIIVAATQSRDESSALTVLSMHSRGGRAPLAVWPAATSLAERARPALTNFMKLALEQKMQACNNQ